MRIKIAKPGKTTRQRKLSDMQGKQAEKGRALKRFPSNLIHLGTATEWFQQKHDLQVYDQYPLQEWKIVQLRILRIITLKLHNGAKQSFDAGLALRKL